MTIADEIAKCLKEKCYGEVVEKVQNYLSTTKNGEITEKEGQRKAAFALRFLYHFMELWDEIELSATPKMIEMISLCHEYIQGYQTESSDPVHEQKILYHILSKSLKRELLDDSTALAKVVLSSLQLVPEEHKSQMQPLAYGAYASAWNVALRLADTSLPSVFKLRQAAISSLLLSDKNIAMVMERTTWTLEIYINQAKKENGSAKEICANVLHLFHEVIDLLQKYRSDEVDYEKSYIELHYRVLHFLLSSNKSDSSNEIADKLKRATEITEKLKNSGKALNNLHQVEVWFLQCSISVKFDCQKETGLRKSSGDSPKSNALLKLLVDISKALDSVDLKNMSQAELQLLVSCGSLFVRQVDQDTSSLSEKKISWNDLLKAELLKICYFLVSCCKSQELLNQNNKKKEGNQFVWLCQELNRSVSLILFLRQSSVQLSSDRPWKKCIEKVREAKNQLCVALAQFKKGGIEEVEETLKETVKIISEHRSHLVAVLKSNCLKMTADHLAQLGSTSTKFGRWCSRRLAHDKAGKFMQETKICYKTVVKSELLSTEKLAQCRLWNKMELSAECWRLSYEYQEAKEAVVLGLLWEPLEYRAAAATWARIQTDICKNSSEDKPHVPQSLWNAVKDKGNPDLDAATILKEEFHVHKRSRWGRAEVERHLVEELLTVVTSKEERGIYLLEKAFLLWSLEHDNKRALHCCEEAVALLEEVLSSISQKKHIIVVKDHLARAYLWRHLVKEVKMDKSKSETLTTNPSEKGGDLEDPNDYQDCFTVNMENFADVDLARKLWTEVVGVKNVNTVLWLTNSTLENLSVLSSVYRLANKPKEELAVLQMLMKLAQSSEKDEFVLQGFLRLLENSCHLQQPELVSHHLVAMEIWMKNGALIITDKPVTEIWYLMAKAAALVFVGKLSEGMDCFERAEQLKEEYTQNKARTKSVFMLDGTLKLFQARLSDVLEAESNVATILTSGENSTELRLGATRILSGIVCYQFGEWVLTTSGKKEGESTGEDDGKRTGKGVNQLETDCWGVLSLVMDCLSETGSSLTRLGDYREAKCYLLQGLKVAQDFHVPRRFAEFHLALAHLDNLAGKFSSSIAHMNTAAYLLQGGRSMVVAEEEKEDEDGEEEMVIQTVDVKQEDEDDSEPLRSSIGGSPKAKRRSPPKTPPHWSHPESCDCARCEDIILNRLHLRLILMEAECLQFQKHYTDAEKFCNIFQKYMQVLVNKGKNALERILDGDQSGLLCPSLYQDLQTEMNLLLVERGLEEQDYHLQTDALIQVDSMLNTKDSYWTKVCATVLAYFQYLEAVPSVKWPPPGDDEEVTSLTSAVQKINLSDTAVTKTPRQPIPSRKVRAPRKDVTSGENEGSETPVEPPSGKVVQLLPKSESLSKIAAGKSVKKKKEKEVVHTPNNDGNDEVSTPQVPLRDITKLMEQTEKLATPPRSSIKASRRAAAVHAILDSDSDEEWKPTTCDAPTRKKRPQKGRAGKGKQPMEVDSKKDVMNAVISQENVFDFMPSGDERTPKKVASKVQGKTTSRAKKNTKSDVKTLGDNKTKSGGSSMAESAQNLNRRAAKRNTTKNQKLDLNETEQARELPEENEDLVNCNLRLSLPEDCNRMSGKLSIGGELKGSKDAQKLISTSNRTTTSKLPVAVSSKNKTTMKTEYDRALQSDLKDNKGKGSSAKSNVARTDGNRSKLSSNSTKTVKNSVSTLKEQKTDSDMNVKKNVKGTEGKNCKNAVQTTRKVRMTRGNTQTAEKERLETSESDELDMDVLELSINMPEDEMDSSYQRGNECFVDGDDYSSMNGSPAVSINSFSPLSLTGVVLSSFDVNGKFVSGIREPVTEILQEDLTDALPPLEDLLNSSIEIARAGDEDEDVKPRPKSKAKSKACQFNIYEDAPEKPRRTKVKPSARKGSVNFAAKDEVVMLEKSPKRPDKVEPKSPIELLERAFKMLKKHPAYLPYRQTCHALAVSHMNKTKYVPSLPMNTPPSGEEHSADTLWNVAYYLTEAQAVTFRHQALRNINRKIRKIETAGTVSRISAVTDAMTKLGLENKVPDDLRKMQSLLTFDLDINEVKDMVESIPKDLVVCHLSVAEPPGQVPCLIASRFQAGVEPLIVHLPGFSSQKGQKLLTEYEAVQVANKESLITTHKAVWWSRREQQDARMKTLLEQIEYTWLGVWRGILHGLLKEENDRENLRMIATAVQKSIFEATGVTMALMKLQILLQATSPLSTEAICQWLSLEISGITAEKMAALAKTIVQEHKKLILLLSFSDHKPVVLVLDKVIQQIPWENLPELRSTPVCRMPSLHFLRFYVRNGPGQEPCSPYNKGVDPSKTYYVLDPENNLSSTREQFQKKFKERNWKGVIGREPTTEEYAEALTKNDLFIYCGHGGGGKYLSGDNLQWLQNNAVALLMGCSSGKLANQGRLESHGLIMHYFLAGCPSMVGCLWDVTDKDIDRYLERLLSRWIDPQSDDSTLLPVVAAQSRSICKMPYLVGAAPVVYGMPVSAIR